MAPTWKGPTFLLEKGPRFSGGRTNKEGTHVVPKVNAKYEDAAKYRGALAHLVGRYIVWKRALSLPTFCTLFGVSTIFRGALHLPTFCY